MDNLQKKKEKLAALRKQAELKAQERANKGGQEEVKTERSGNVQNLMDEIMKRRPGES